jgi:hypothetical protein
MYVVHPTCAMDEGERGSKKHDNSVPSSFIVSFGATL